MPAKTGRTLTLPVCFILLIFFTQISAGQTTHAQSAVSQSAASPSEASDSEALQRNEFGVFGVLPLANGSLKGVTSDRQFFLFGLSYSRLLGHNKVCDIRWVSEIVPVEFLREPFVRGTEFQTIRSFPFTGQKSTYGLGTNPAGADVAFLPGHRWQPYAGVHAGFSYFTRNVLSSQAAQFNFMLDGRAGLRFSLDSGKALSVAYMFQHMSNAYAAVENPGVDSHMIHVAYSFPWWFGHGAK